MSDEGDKAADFQQAEIERSLAAHAARKRPDAARNCVDCNEELNTARRGIGACRCVDCQGDREKASRHFVRYGKDDL